MHLFDHGSLIPLAFALAAKLGLDPGVLAFLLNHKCFLRIFLHVFDIRDLFILPRMVDGQYLPDLLSESHAQVHVLLDVSQ